MQIVTPEARPHIGAVTGMIEFLAFLRDLGFVGRRFSEFGNVFKTVLAGQPQIFVRGKEAVAELMAQFGSLEGQ